MPLPSKDFDPTEAGVIFYQLMMQGCEVIIATPRANVAEPDQLMFTGKKLGLLKYALMADKNGRLSGNYMLTSKSFKNPISYDAINVNEYDGIVLPGGHDKGMREYLESKILQHKVLEFDESKKLIAAICHGVIVLARTKNKTGRSILFNKKVTSLLKNQEMLAFNLTRVYLGDYYLTYPITVEDEVKSVLQDENQFKSGIKYNNFFTVSLLKRDEVNKYDDSFVVHDENILTARWPGDAHYLSRKILDVLSM